MAFIKLNSKGLHQKVNKSVWAFITMLWNDKNSNNTRSEEASSVSLQNCFITATKQKKAKHGIFSKWGIYEKRGCGLNKQGPGNPFRAMLEWFNLEIDWCCFL